MILPHLKIPNEYQGNDREHPFATGDGERSRPNFIALVEKLHEFIKRLFAVNWGIVLSVKTMTTIAINHEAHLREIMVAVFSKFRLFGKPLALLVGLKNGH